MNNGIEWYGLALVLLTQVDNYTSLYCLIHKEFFESEEQYQIVAGRIQIYL